MTAAITVVSLAGAALLGLIARRAWTRNVPPLPKRDPLRRLVEDLRDQPALDGMYRRFLAERDRRITAELEPLVADIDVESIVAEFEADQP